MDDDFFDEVEDLLDPMTAEGFTFVAGSGLLDDEDDADGEHCACWCDCRRRTSAPNDTCKRCQADRHVDG